MECPSCSTPVRGDEKFCPNCGADLRPAAQPTQQLPQSPPQGTHPSPPPPAPAAQPTAQMPAAAPGAEPAKKSNNTVLIIVLAVLGVFLLCACGTAAGVLMWALPVKQKVQEVTAPAPPAAVTTGTAQSGASAPEAAIEDFYAAVAGGDLAAIRATLADGFKDSIDASTFEGWTAPDIQIGTPDTSAGESLATVEVQEADGGLSNGFVTFNLVNTGSGWLISGWTLGAAPAAEPAAPAAPKEPTFDEATAIDTVGRLLNALKEDDVAGARALATKNFKKSDPTFFRETNGVFMQFEVVDAFRDGGTWIVTVREVWNSGPEEIKYVVVIENGRVLVDDQL